MIIGAPAASCGRGVRRRRIVSRGGWIVAVVAVWGIIRVIVVRVRERRTEREGAEPDPDSRTGTDPTCTCGSRRRHQPDSGKDRRGDGQPTTSLPKETTNSHTFLLSFAQPCELARKAAV